MTTSDWSLRLLLGVIAFCLAVLVWQGTRFRSDAVYAADARFDHINVLTTSFLYKGEPGLLMLDRRNGNVWFMTNKQGVFGEPVYLTRVPFEKLDQMPQP